MFIKSEESVSRILQSVGTGDLNIFRDVRIRCSGAGGGRSESVFCHQTILSSFSPFLASLLASSCSCKSDINIVLQDVNIQTVQVGSLSLSLSLYLCGNTTSHRLSWGSSTLAVSR